MVDRHSNSDYPRCMAAWRAALTQLAVAWGSDDIDPSRQYAFCPFVNGNVSHDAFPNDRMTAYQKRLTQETKTKIRRLEISRYSSFTKSSFVEESLALAFIVTGGCASVPRTAMTYR
jgi:hypothetical protein